MELLKKLFKSKFEKRHESIDHLIRSNFILNETSLECWFFNTKYRGCLVCFFITFGRYYENQVCINTYSPNQESSMSYEDFMSNGIEVINSMAKRHHDVRMDDIKLNGNIDVRNKEFKNILPQEDLEDILSEIRDLSYFSYEISFFSSIRYLNGIEDPYYSVQFSMSNRSDESFIEEKSEFYRILSSSMKRIRNGYNVNVSYEDDKYLLEIKL